MKCRDARGHPLVLPAQRPNISLYAISAGTISIEYKKCYNRWIDGLLDPSKYKPYRSNKMSDGLNLTGFNDTKPATTTSWPTESYTEAPASAPSATDKSSQDGSGLGNGGK